MRRFLHAGFYAYKFFWLSYECNCMQGESRKYCSWCWSYGANYRKKITANYNSFEKMNPLKGHPVKNVQIRSLTLVLIFWWIEVAILRSHRKVCRNFIFNFEDIWKRRFVFHQTLNAFFHTGKAVSSWLLGETS